MAASLRVAGTRADGTGTSLNPNYPAGIQAGDLILMHAFFHEGTTTTTGSWIVPSGFTLVRARSITVAGAKKGELMVCARRATGSESGAHGSVLRTGGSGNGTVSTINMTVWQDVGGSTDLDGIEAITDVADESPPYGMTVTTLGSDRLVLAWVFANDNVSSTGTSAGWTNVIAPYTDATGADYAGHVASIVKATAGAQSGSWSQSAGIEGALIGLALIPVPPPSGVNADIAASVLAPIASLSASLGFNGTVAASVPAPTAALSGSLGFTSDVTASVPAPVSSADAVLTNPISGVSADIAVSIPAPTSLSRALLPTDFTLEVLATGPDYFWPMDEAADPLVDVVAGAELVSQLAANNGFRETGLVPVDDGWYSVRTGTPTTTGWFNNSTLVNVPTEYSLGAWIEWASANRDEINLFDGHDRLTYITDNLRYSITDQDFNSWTIDVPYVPGTNVFVVVTHGPAGAKLYVNGVLAGSDSHPGLQPLWGTNLPLVEIFGRGGNHDALAYWDRVLDPSEVADLYSAAIAVDINADIAAVIPAPTTSASASSLLAIAGTVAASIPAPTSSLSASESFASTVAASIPAPSSASVAVVTGPFVATIAASIPAPTTSISAQNTAPFTAVIASSISAPVASLSASTAAPFLGHVTIGVQRPFGVNVTVARQLGGSFSLRGGIDVGHTTLTVEEDHG